jgi:hypothetical protein
VPLAAQLAHAAAGSAPGAGASDSPLASDLARPPHDPQRRRKTPAPPPPVTSAAPVALPPSRRPACSKYHVTAMPSRSRPARIEDIVSLQLPSGASVLLLQGGRIFDSEI